MDVNRMLISSIVISVALFLLSHSSYSQQVLSVKRIAGPREVEVSGSVLRYGRTVAFVGRNSLWALDTLSNDWSELYSAPVGSSIVASVEERNGSIVFLDMKQILWRCTPDASIERITSITLPAESYTLCAGDGDIVVCGFYRLLGNIGAVRVSTHGVETLEALTPEMANLAVRSLEYSERCSSFILSVEGYSSDQLSRKIHKRFMLKGTEWVLIDENQNTPRSFVDSKGYQTCIIVGDSLYTTTSCPPSQSGPFVTVTPPRSALARISDSTIALFTPYTDKASEPTIFIVDAAGSVVVDTVTCPKGSVIFNVTAMNDLIIVNCRDVVQIYRGGSLFRRVRWPSSESSASFRNAICSRENVLLYNGFSPPAIYSSRTSTWSPLFAIRDGDTSRIIVINDGVARDSLLYLWNDTTLYVSKEHDSEKRYYDVLSCSRRIMHVRPLPNGDALVAVSIPERDTIQPYWHLYSHATGAITSSIDNWPRNVQGLEPVASIYDPHSGMIVIGTRTEWYGFQSDSSVYPIHGVLRRNTATSEWSMANEGLGLSLRCIALQQDPRGWLYMSSAYSDGFNMTRPSLYTSTDLGASWQSTAQPPPMDLGKKYALSVTSSGAYVHDQSCYRVVAAEGTFEPVTFSNDQLGTIYAMRSGIDSTTMFILTSTGLYKAQLTLTSTGINVVSHESATVNGTLLTIRSAALNDNCYVRIMGIGGQCLFEGRLRQSDVGLLSVTLDSELPSGVYFVIAGDQQVIRMMHLNQ